MTSKIPHYARCETCANRLVRTETIKYSSVDVDGTPIPGDSEVVYEGVQRCAADRPKNREHPFGDAGFGPVLTPREMRLNGCRDLRYWKPIEFKKSKSQTKRVNTQKEEAA